MGWQASRHSGNQGTLTAVPTAAGMKAQENAGRPWLLVTPARQADQPLFLDTAEVAAACGPRLPENEVRSSRQLPDGMEQALTLNTYLASPLVSIACARKCGTPATSRGDAWVRTGPGLGCHQMVTVDDVQASFRRHPGHCGIFPRTDELGTCADDLLVDPENFEDVSVEVDDDGWIEVQRLVERGWIKQFESYSELCAFLGEDPVLSKFGIITKV